MKSRREGRAILLLALLAAALLLVWRWTAPGPSAESPVETADRLARALEAQVDEVSAYGPPVDQAFPAIALTDARRLREQLGDTVADRVAELLKPHRCNSAAFTLFRRDPQGAGLLVSNCRRILEAAAQRHEEVLDLEYPVMFWIAAPQPPAVQELTGLGAHRFLDESGRLLGVSDPNGDGHLHLWLYGATFDCSDDDVLCDGESGIELEIISGDKLRRIEPAH